MLKTVVDSCYECVNNAKYVKINKEKLQQFVDTIEQEKKENAKVIEDVSQPWKLPVNYESVAEEVNVDCLYSILQFGSGYRMEFHKACGRGASDVIVFGLMQMCLSEVKIDSKFLKSFTIQQAGEYFNFPLRVFKKFDDMPIEVTADSELMPFAQKMKMVMNHLGEQLEKEGCKDFYEFAEKCLKEEQEKTGNPNKKHLSADFFTEKLVNTFPIALRDTGICKYEKDGKEFEIEVFFLKKAQLVLGELYRNVSAECEMFKFEGIEKLTLFVDNVIPSYFYQIGCIEFTEAGKEKAEKQLLEKIPLPNDQFLHEYRAAAVICGVECVKIAKDKEIDMLYLDYLIWGIKGKEKAYRELRHYCRDTVFY